MKLPCGGHKSPPLIARWPGFDWYRMSPPELMHDSKIFLEMLLKVWVGKVSGTGFYATAVGATIINTVKKPNFRVYLNQSGRAIMALYLGVSPLLKEKCLTREWES